MEKSKRYMGVKMLSATPVTLGEYNKIRGWTMPADENPQEEGYMVTYPGGYMSWSPKQQFEAAYIEVPGDGTKVTESMVERFIAAVIAEGRFGNHTVVRTELRSGFTIITDSACVTPENYDHILGTKYAVDKAKKEIWGYLAFVLAWARKGLS